MELISRWLLQFMLTVVQLTAKNSGIIRLTNNRHQLTLWPGSLRGQLPPPPMATARYGLVNPLYSNKAQGRALHSATLATVFK